MWLIAFWLKIIIIIITNTIIIIITIIVFYRSQSAVSDWVFVGSFADVSSTCVTLTEKWIGQVRMQIPK